MQAVVLAGGFGKRLAPLTSEVPKPLLPVGGRPILVREIEWLRGFGVTDVVLAVGYLRHKVFEALGDGRGFGVRIFYSVEEEPLGTAGAIRNAEPFMRDDVFIVLNGDILTNLSLDKLVEALGYGAAVATPEEAAAVFSADHIPEPPVAPLWQYHIAKVVDQYEQLIKKIHP